MTAWIENLVFRNRLLVVVFGVAYLALNPRALKPPETVSSLAELESYLEDLVEHNVDSPPGLSLVVAKDGEIVYQKGFGMADGPRRHLGRGAIAATGRQAK